MSAPSEQGTNNRIQGRGNGHGIAPIEIQTPPTSMMAGKRKLDLLVLTFNAAKKIIDTPVFAHHLESALVANATTLPEVVVFSLQEISPLSYAFIGGPLLNPFLARYEEALNLAAIKIQSTPTTPATPVPAAVPTDNDADDEDEGSPPPSTPQHPNYENQPQQQQRVSLLGSWRRHPNRRPYTLVKQHNIGMTAIMLFARHPAAVSQVELAEVGFGTLDMGNKGAVAIRCIYRQRAPLLDHHQREAAAHHTQLTFVATHLAPMEWNLKRRNANWRSICSALVFGNPVTVIKKAAKPEDKPSVNRILRRKSGGRVSDSAASPAPTEEEEADAARLLAEAEEHDGALAAHLRDALRDMTIFRPGAHVFVAGDLNYRISDESPRREDPFPSHDEASEHYWAKFLARDQLAREREAGRVLQGFNEGKIAFPPTYKYDDLPGPEGAANEAEAREAAARGEADLVVPWRFAKHRWPSWTDRVLFMDVPEFAQPILDQDDGEADTSSSDDGTKVRERNMLDVRAYRSLPLMRSSDHQPVFLRVGVPVLAPAELGRDAAKVLSKVVDEGMAEEMDEEERKRKLALLDPRVRPPYPVDIHATARRNAARLRELVSGCTMLLWCTQEGALALGSLALVGVATYWLWYGVF